MNGPVISTTVAVKTVQEEEEIAVQEEEKIAEIIIRIHSYHIKVLLMFAR
jgi:hypothetical protein